MKNVYNEFEKKINSMIIPDSVRARLEQALILMREQKLNILITGATGCGKSSTINAMFGEKVAKVGVGVDPETMDIQKYPLGNMILWDSPGLGDGKEADNRHAKNIIKKLAETDENGNALIDLVLVILDASSKDLGTSYELINSVIIPNFPKDRILIAINQADMAMKGKHWNEAENKPDEILESYLNDKADSIRSRILASTGVDVETIYYSAGYTDENIQMPPYNLTKLFSYILRMTPTEKRLAYCDNINNDKEMWKHNDELEDYSTQIRSSFMETVKEFARQGADIGETIGETFGAVGRFVGRAAGTVVGGLVGALGSIFDLF